MTSGVSLELELQVYNGKTNDVAVVGVICAGLVGKTCQWGLPSHIAIT